MTKQSKKQVQNQAQDGRSMIEMLGVLAVIAVLSIGGIVGYKLAMNHYQASQIAHEMNMMRTDAQIKIAQGTENLTLGSPYDAHKINFNGYETAFGCKYVDENDLISNETVSCQIANAYFIELPKIPDGVCQPLIRLINGMDNLIAFSVNNSEYEEGGTCQEGENDLYAVFSGETVSDLTHCERDDDCKELENTPVCDLSRHVCVECTQKEDCTQGNGGICIENKCDYCANGEIRDESSKCVECLTYENCTGKPETPQCDEISHTCKSCAEIDSSKSVWADTQCVECLSSADCKNPEKPLCDTITNTCIECETNAQCAAKGKDPHCHKATHTCEPCPDGSQNDTVRKACVIQIQTIAPFFLYTGLDHIKNCQKITPQHFGPYSHSYEVWAHGTFDDYIRFYVNEELSHISSTEPTLDEPDNNCNKVPHRGVIRCIGQSCSGYVPDSLLGSLNVGEFGHLTVYDGNHWMSWGGSGYLDKLTNDAAAWLVLGDE